MKRAQGAIRAAMLIAIIFGLIMVYIIFLPADEREALLENKTNGKSAGSFHSSGVDDEVLVREFPGRLNTVEDVDSEFLPNVFLFETTNAETLERFNPFIVRNGWFDKQMREVQFSVDDAETIDNVVLTFNPKKSQGILTIWLNGETIYENEVVGQNVEPIRIRNEALRQDNTLKFAVSTVGARFWSTNEYQLDNVQIIADITDKSKQEAQNIFTLTDEDIFNIEEANLRFVPYCQGVAQVGRLEVFVNNRRIFNAVPVCEDPYKQPIPSNIFSEGVNNVVFKTSSGSYSIEQVRIDFDERDIDEHVYFFELNETHIEEIEDDDADVLLSIEFVEDRKSKRADLNINNRFEEIDQSDRFFGLNLNEFVVDGNNFVEIRPRTELDIVEVRVDFDEN